MEKDFYKTIKSFSSFELKIQKSTFIAQAYSFTNSDEFEKIKSEVRKKYFDSAHNPFAWRAGLDENHFRFNDDGEPSGSAGKPVLDAIDKFGLTDIIIFVSRYFGGVKLGVGGLKRAFFDAAEGCLQNAEIIEKFIYQRVSVSFDYKFIGSLMNYIEKNSIHIIENKSGTQVNLICDIRKSAYPAFEDFLRNLTSGKYDLQQIQP